MYFPVHRPRRLRANPTIRRMISETTLEVNDLIYPMFVVEGKSVRNQISSMPGNFQLSIDEFLKEAKLVESLGIPAIIIFGIPSIKDEEASQAYSETGIVQRTIRALKDAGSNLMIITDVCLCEYMSHGHCGIVENGHILNDPSLALLAETALSHAKAGADMVAPSDMMDGRVGAIRETLDEHGFTDLPIMAYAAKYASSFYGPFREAAESTPSFGDRRTYQMDPPNAVEAMREAAMDIDEGADIIMVKPAMPYLDIIALLAQEFPYPIAAYNVSGEFSMIKAAAANGWLDERLAVMETLMAIKRAGADIILTYHAMDAARWLNE